MAEKEFIEREAVNALIEAECSPKVAAFLNHAIDNIPAADVRPVKRGRWELDSDPGEPWRYVCNICGEKTKDTVMGKPRANYCPNCGAYMSATDIDVGNKKCTDCQRDCQMIGLDMPACTAYKPLKEDKRQEPT